MFWRISVIGADSEKVSGHRKHLKGQSSVALPTRKASAKLRGSSFACPSAEVLSVFFFAGVTQQQQFEKV
jgi:hypothetical protein